MSDASDLDTANRSRAGAYAWAAFRVALILPLYGCAWLSASAVALAYYGARAGWRDARDFSEGD